MNKAYLIGNLTRDPETRQTQSGLTVCNFTLAVNRRMAKDGQQQTDFINVVAWRQLGDLCKQYLSKGKKCAVVGSIQTRTYEAQDGSKRNAFEIVADEVEFLSPAEGRQSRQEAPSAPQMTQVDDEPLPF